MRLSISDFKQVGHTTQMPDLNIDLRNRYTHSQFLQIGNLLGHYRLFFFESKLCRKRPIGINATAETVAEVDGRSEHQLLETPLIQQLPL